MNGKKFWIEIWPEKIKQSKRNNNSKALSFLETWVLNDPSNALNELIEGTNAYKAGRWGSAYVVQIPNGDKEAIRNRWSNHPSKETEWPLKEIDGLPNRRYSIYIYDKNTVPEFANIAETKWKSYYSEGIPVYEKGFNVDFLRNTFPKLKNILLMIYKGGVPQPNKLPIKIDESITKQDTNMKTENRKRNVVRLTESQLKQMIAESVKNVLKEWNSDDDFICHGCKAWSNWGGIEMQISDGGDEARLRYPDGEITDWLEIEYDEEGVAYITAPNGEIERFDEYERVR